MAWYTSNRTLWRGNAVSPRFELDCTECSFQTTMACEFDEVFDVIEAHRDERYAGPTEHFVNIHRVSAIDEE